MCNAEWCAPTACRIDSGAAVSAEAMVGRELRILWPDDDAWFCGTVDSYDSSSGQHMVWHPPTAHFRQSSASHDGKRQLSAIGRMNATDDGQQPLEGSSLQHVDANLACR